ncbi:MAG: HDOD domain-containing protein [Burkholderiaceae bacterium]|nr:HDOD domain-containing protein [Burkholderiaceae bacterium]
MEPAAGSLAIVPIVDRRERMTGIRLAGAGTSASILLAHVGARGIDGVLLFVDRRLSQLDDPALPEFDPRAWIVQLVHGTGDTAELPARLAAHRTRGLRFAIGDAGPGSPWLTQLSCATHARVDIGSLPESHLARYTAALRHRGLKTVAAGVANRAGFAAALAAGFDAVEGHWFTELPDERSDAVAPLYGTVMRALALLRGDRDAAEVELAIRADPALAFRLLRYVNSAAFAPRNELGSIEDAIAMLGQRALTRWLGLSLVTARVERGAGAALAVTAIMRARLMELLRSDAGVGPGERAGTSANDASDAFMTGLFSALDAIVGQPMQRIVASVDPQPEVARALLERAGDLGALLELVLACEVPDAARLDTLADRCAVPSAKLQRMQLDALRWAMNELGQ